MSKVWILAKTGYEEFTVCGVYLDHDLAERERIRLEQDVIDWVESQVCEEY